MSTASGVLWAILPRAVAWGPPLLLVALGWSTSRLASAVGIRASFLRSERIADPQWHWSERARWSFPVRQTAGLALGLLPVAFGIIAAKLCGPLRAIPYGIVGLCAGLAAWMGAFASCRAIEVRIIGKAVPFRKGLASAWSVTLLNYSHVLIAEVLALTLHGALTHLDWLIVSIALLFMAFTAAGGGLLFTRAVGLAHPASDRLRGIAGAIPRSAGVPAPAVFEIQSLTANAYAFPLTNTIVFTTGVLDALDDEQIGVVCSHEMGHLTESRIVGIYRVVVALAVLVPVAFIQPLLARDHVWLIVGISWLPVIFARVAIRTFRKMEERADRAAHAFEATPGVYARALERIYEVNQMPAVGTSTRTHPHLYDRMITAGIQPSFVRPKPPSRNRMRLGLFAMLAICGVAWSTVAMADTIADSLDLEPARYAAVVIGGGEPSSLGQLAFSRFERGDPKTAARLYQAAASIDRDNAWYNANLAIALSVMGRCAEATVAAEEARTRALRLAGPNSPLDQRQWELAELATLNASVCVPTEVTK